MSKELQEKLYQLQRQGYRFKFDVGPYLDGFCVLSRRADGKIVFESQVYSDFELDRVRVYHVEVFKPIDNWETL